MSFSDFHIAGTPHPESEKSVNSALGGPALAQSNGARTATVTIEGNDALFVAPGFVLVLADVGRPV